MSGSDRKQTGKGMEMPPDRPHTRNNNNKKRKYNKNEKRVYFSIGADNMVQCGDTVNQFRPSAKRINGACS